MSEVPTGEMRVTRAPRRGMIGLRGDLASADLQRVCSEVAGVPFPGPLQVKCADESGLCWMSPDEVLILVPHDRLKVAQDRVNVVLQDTHFMSENLSDARALFCVEGSWCREVIAKNAPVDLHPDVFVPGQIRRSRLGQVAAAFWMRDDRTFQVICFASVADYVQELLDVSVLRGPVGYFRKAKTS